MPTNLAEISERIVNLELPIDIPNSETIEAMLEAERLSRDVNAKRYSNFREAFIEVMSDDQV